MSVALVPVYLKTVEKLCDCGVGDRPLNSHYFTDSSF